MATPLARQQPPYKLLLKHHYSPGDVLVLTSVVESLHRQFPGSFRVAVETTCSEVWANNPHVEDLEAHYCHIEDIPNRGDNQTATKHFMACLCDHLAKKLGVPLTLQVSRPSLYLSEAERSRRWFPDPYLVVNAGTKSDYTVKGWGQASYQRVVAVLGDRVRVVQIGTHQDAHQPLDGATNLIGKTSVRELFSLVNGSAGGLGGVTFLGHICAALEKPYVCLAGGREDRGFTEYPTQTTFYGNASCAPCWKARTVKIGDGCNKDDSLCVLPVVRSTEVVPACMNSISPDEVITAIRHYLRV